MRKPFREEEIFDLLAKHLGVRYIYEEVDHRSLQKPLANLLHRRAMQSSPNDWQCCLSSG